MGPKSIENNVLKIFGRDLSKIGAPVTPGVYHGTKNLVPKDTPGVPGAPISERSRPKIFKKLFSIDLGPI